MESWGGPAGNGKNTRALGEASSSSSSEGHPCGGRCGWCMTSFVRVVAWWWSIPNFSWDTGFFWDWKSCSYRSYDMMTYTEEFTSIGYSIWRCPLAEVYSTKCLCAEAYTTWGSVRRKLFLCRHSNFTCCIPYQSMSGGYSISMIISENKLLWWTGPNTCLYLPLLLSAHQQDPSRGS